MKQRATIVHGERWNWLPYLVLVVGLLLTAIVTVTALENVRLRTRQEFETAVNQIETNIRERMEAYVALLRGGAGLFAVNKWVSADEFRSYVSRLRVQESYPGAQGIGFAYRVTSKNRGELLHLLESQGITGFKVWPQTEGPESFPIIYLEPLDARNRAALGYDMFSEPLRREAMEKARDTGSPAATHKVTLVQEIVGPRQPGFLIYVPIYRSGEIPESMVERQRDIEGFVYSPFRTHDLLSPIVKNGLPFPLDVEVYDGKAFDPDALLFSNISTAIGPEADLRQTRVVEVAGLEWSIRFSTFSSKARPTNLFVLIPAGGTLVSLLLFYFTYAESMTRRRWVTTAVQLQASETELTRQREWLRTTLTSIGDAVIATDTAGNIEFMNRAAEELTGWSGPEAVGKPLDDVFHVVSASTRRPIESPVQKVLETGRTMALASNALLVNRNRQERAIADTAAPIRDVNGATIGVVLVFHDATAERQADELRARKAMHAALRADVSDILSRPGISELQILQLCVEAFVKYLGAALARIWIYDDLQRVLDLQASAGLYTHKTGRHARIPLGKLKIGKIAEEKQPHLTNDLLNSSWLDDPQWAKEQGLVAFAGYPLVVEGELVGVVALFSKNRIAEDTLDALAPIADLLAAGIQRKRSDEVLRSSESRFRGIFEQAAVGIEQMALDGKFLEVNQRLCQMLGYSREELLRKTSLGLTHPDDREREIALIDELIAGKRSTFTIEKRYIAKAGGIVPVRVTCSIVRENGTGYRIAIVEDISEQKRAQEALSESEERFRLLFEQSPLAIQLFAPDGAVVAVNNAWEKLWHSNREELRGYNVLSDPQLEAKGVRSLIKRAFAGETVSVPPIYYDPADIGKQGQPRWVEAFLYPVRAGSSVGQIVLILNDVTERRRAEDALRASQHQLQTIADALPVLISSVDSELRYRFANRAYETWFGKPVSALIGNYLGTVLGEQAMGKLRPYFERALGGERVDFEDEVIFAGRARFIHSTLIPEFDNNGLVAGVFVLALDITQRRGMEEALRESEQRFRLIFERAQDFAIFTLDTEGRISSWNPGAERILRYTEAEILGQDGAMFFTDEDRKKSEPEKELQGARDSGQALDERWHCRKGGELFFASGYMIALRDVEGKLRGFAKIMRDITERKKIEEALRDSEERLRLTIESIAEYALFTLDAEGRIASWNAGAERLFGFLEKEVVGRSREMLFTAEDVQRGVLQKELEIAIERNHAFHERWHQKKTGERFWASDYIVALREPGGNLRGFAKIVRDMTEQKRAQEKIEELNRDLEKRVRERTAALQESNEQMETFTYTVAHDLRAPLRAMQGFSQALLEEYSTSIDELGKDFLFRIVGASKRMDALIQDLLAYSQLTRLDLTFSRASLQNSVENAFQMLSHEIAQRNAIVTAEELLPDVLAHQATLDTLVFNLINNAIKFVDPAVQPKVHVWAERREVKGYPPTQTRYFVRLWIEDNGIGIAPEHQERIFKVFERLHGVGEFTGTGIGLALVKKGVDRMGGRVGLESELGKGSKFWIELPAA